MQRLSPILLGHCRLVLLFVRLELEFHHLSRHLLADPPTASSAAWHVARAAAAAPSAAVALAAAIAAATGPAAATAIAIAAAAAPSAAAAAPSAAVTLAAGATGPAGATASYRAVGFSGCGLLSGRQWQQPTPVELLCKLSRHGARVRAALRGDRRVRVLRPRRALHWRLLWVQGSGQGTLRAVHRANHRHPGVWRSGLHSSPT